MTDNLAVNRTDAIRLFFLGCNTLFLELVFIRYLAGNIWNLGYFPNLVLMSVFIGMGLGFGLNRRLSESVSLRIHGWVWTAILLLTGFVYVFQPKVPFFRNDAAGTVGGELFFTANRSDDTSYFLFIAVFVAIVAIFAMISQRTARLFCRFSPLKSYTLDIAGSCAGIILFMGVSFFQLPAWSWFLLAGTMYLFTLPIAPVATAMILLPAVCCAFFSYAQDKIPIIDWGHQIKVQNRWSPYQKVGEGLSYKPGYHMVYVNGVSHQDIFPPEDLPSSFYVRPHISRKTANLPPYKNVLVIGAGSGNDVAAAITNGAEHVDAVEIDPVIADLGRRYNRHKVYENPKVNVVVDDGRAFMMRTDRKYDLVIFALTDSLVRVSAVTQLRLENYIFTLESVRRAYELLNPDGEIVFYNYYRYPWLVKKIRTIASAASGKEAETIYTKQDFAMMRVRKTDDAAPPPMTLKAIPGLNDLPTDDWPFLYLRTRGIPDIYLGATAFLLGIVAALFFLLEATGNGALKQRVPGLIPTGLAFFLMGVAFLLLETKSIIQFSLLFGTTWLNNSLVFLAVLLLVLAANWVASRFKSGRALLSVAFVLLIGSCLLGLFYPLGNLLSVKSTGLRFVLASLLTFSPIFFANLIFSVTFRDKHDIADRLFGWNLIGATLGGALEYSSMGLGYNALGLIVAVTYVLVFVCLAVGRRGMAARESTLVTDPENQSRAVG